MDLLLGGVPEGERVTLLAGDPLRLLPLFLGGVPEGESPSWLGISLQGSSPSSWEGC